MCLNATLDALEMQRGRRRKCFAAISSVTALCLRLIVALNQGNRIEESNVLILFELYSVFCWFRNQREEMEGMGNAFVCIGL